MERLIHRYGPAGLFLLFGVGFLVMAATEARLTTAVLGFGFVINGVLRIFGFPDRAQERRRLRLEAKYKSQQIPAQPDNPPRWFSPDNPPGWYLNPATNDAGYWSELGWRTPGS